MNLLPITVDRLDYVYLVFKPWFDLCKFHVCFFIWSLNVLLTKYLPSQIRHKNGSFLCFERLWSTSSDLSKHLKSHKSHWNNLLSPSLCFIFKCPFSLCWVKVLKSQWIHECVHSSCFPCLWSFNVSNRENLSSHCSQLYFFTLSLMCVWLMWSLQPFLDSKSFPQMLHTIFKCDLSSQFDVLFWQDKTKHFSENSTVSCTKFSSTQVWLFRLWLFSCGRLPARKLHCSHLKVFSRWTFWMCLVIARFVDERYSHCVQLINFALCTYLLCWSKLGLYSDLYSHSSQV